MESESGKERIILARPGTLPWLGAGFCWFMAVLVTVIAIFRANLDDREVDWPKAIIVLLFWLILGTLPGLFAGLSQVVGTTEGLRWRKWLPWKPSLTWQTTSWEDITDFYDTTNALGTSSVVEVSDEKRLTFDSYWQGFILLRDIIVERAVHVESARDRNGKIAWMPKEARPVALPATFAYTEGRLKKLWRELLFSTISILGIIFVPAGLLLFLSPKRLPPIQTVDGLIIFLLLSSIGLFLVLAMGWSLYQEGCHFREAHQRRKQGEEFVAERDGLTVWREGEARKIPWEEIVGYEFPLFRSRKNRSQYGGVVRFRTRIGEEYSFTLLIDNAPLLATILRQFATEAVEFRRDQNEKEALGGVAARWGGGEEGKGARVFHRRTRTIRASVLSAYAVFAGALWAVVRLFLMPFSTAALFFFGPLALLFGFLAWDTTMEYLQDRVLVDKEGVTHINKRRRKQHKRWEDIERIWTEGNAISITGKDGSNMNLITSGYAYGNELSTLLTEHLALHRRASER